MKNLILKGAFCSAAVILFSLLPALPAAAEFIFLKDGSIVDGTIISDGAASVTVRTADRKVQQISRGEIMRVLYTKLKMDKIYIQKRDGKGLVAYMVDEDQDSYTFRKDITKPEEFSLKRSEVLFISEKNPSGLQVEGEVGTGSVKLFWHPPYDAVKRYNIYIKKREKDKYEPAESVKDKSVFLKNLSSNTTYFIIVTSVDAEDYESSPSNELKITTANIPPSEPLIVSVENMPSGDRKISWKASADPDGRVEKYRVYTTKDSLREMSAEVKKAEVTVKNAAIYKKIEIVAVDDRGAESGTVRAGSGAAKGETHIVLYPGVIFPLGKFGEMAGMAYGGMINLTERNLFFSGFEAGLGAGFYYASGKDMSEKQKPVFENFIIAPLFLNAAYRIILGESFSIAPAISFGAGYIGISYKTRDAVTRLETKKSKSTIDPVFKGGILTEYIFTESFGISLQADYGMFIEKDGNMPFASAALGFHYIF